MDLPIIYSQMEQWNEYMLLYDAALKIINTRLEILNNEFKMANQYNPIEHITSRIKSPESIAKKLDHNGRKVNLDNINKYINDVAGVRVICSFITDIYRIAELIVSQGDIKVIKTKDYIANPKENGYRSYHMIVTIPIFLSNKVVDTKVEIQIRTIAMDFWASLEHKIYYKFEGNTPRGIRDELRECANIIGFLDEKMRALNDEVKSYNIKEDNEYEKDILYDDDYI